MIKHRDIYMVVETIVRKGLWRDLILVGDAALCVYRLPCKARDIDYSGPLSARKRIEKEFRIKWVEKREEYPFHGPGIILHAEINNIPVDFNLEPDPLWIQRYHGSRRIVYYDNMPVITYSLERYIAGRMRRLALMKLKRRWDMAPEEIMDLVPLYCLRSIDHNMVGYWRRRIIAYDFCPDMETVRKAVELSEKELGVSCDYRNVYREIYIDSGCRDCWRCTGRLRIDECSSALASVSRMLWGMEYKWGGSVMLEQYGYKTYLRDIDVFIPADRYNDMLQEIIYKCYTGTSACRAVVSDTRPGHLDLLAGCCWIDLIPLPREIWKHADSLEFYVVSNYINILKHKDTLPQVAKILTKLTVLYVQGLFRRIDWGKARTIMELEKQVGYLSEAKRIDISLEEVKTAAMLFRYVYEPPSNEAHMVYGDSVEKLIEKMVAELNKRLF